MKIKILYKLLVITLFSALIFSGCNQKTKKPVQTDKTPPQSLMKIEEGIDKIISTLDKEGKIQDTKDSASQGNKSDEGSQVKKNDSGNSGSKEDSSNSEGSKESSGNSSNQSQESNNQKSPWEDVDKTVKEIHKSWNEYHPLAVKDGTRNEIVDGFDTDLNILSNNITELNIMSTLENANNLYKYIPEFLSNYDGENINIKRLKYYVRDVMYKGRFEKWDLALLSMNKSDEILVNIRAQSQGDLKDIYSTLEYSVKDLQKVAAERQKNLTQIKGNLVLENIKNMEKQIEKQKEKKENK